MKRRRQRGSVLVLALWLAAGLAAAALFAGHAAVLRYRANAQEDGMAATRQAAAGARRYVAYVLDNLAEPGELPDTDTYEAEDIAIGDCRVWLIGRSDDADADVPTFGLQDEAGRLNLNTATLAMLETLDGLADELAAAIVDWRDADSDLTANGAESDTYLGNDPAYLAKDAPFETVDELRLLNGVDIAALLGRDRNRNMLVEEWEKVLAETNTTRFAEIPDYGLLDMLTVASSEPNLDPDGQPRTDLNGNPGQTIQAITQAFGERGAAIATAAGVGTRQFGSVLEFCVRGGLNDTEAATAFDRFGIGAEQAVQGRVNINTAPAAVLACLPGIGTDNAAALVAWRTRNPDNLTTPMWLAQAVDPENALAAGPYVTTRSYQVTADIVVVAPRIGTFRRERVVFDTTGGSALVVACRDLTALGWPLGQDLYDELITRHGEEKR